MQKELRMEKLGEILSGEPVMTGLKLQYQGETKPYDAYKIPLSCLIYNKYNGRIGSTVKSFEKQYHTLDPEKEDDKKQIENFLWDSKTDRNENTMLDLVEKGQQRFGIVTRDGIIIDGNRRAMLLNRIYRKREDWRKKKVDVEGCQFFIAIILPAEGVTKDVVQLETIYQMGEDEKLGYNAIEKYLKCKDLGELGFEPKDIANMMGEKKATVEEWLSIMELMDSYLDYLDYSGIYTRLEKREGHFVDLNQYLNRYKSRQSKLVDWKYDDSDVSDLQTICFDYIRAQFEGKWFRSIAKPSRKEGVFCDEAIWKDFRDEHLDLVAKVEEPSREEMQKTHPDSDLTKLLSSRDAKWTKNVMDNLKENLGKSEYKLKNISEANRPVDLLARAKSTIEAVNTDHEAFYSPEVLALVKDINAITFEYKKILDHPKREMI